MAAAADCRRSFEEVRRLMENLVKDLEKELNADQDFSKFVRKMRRKFKESV